jgi:RimJ/RimL family protein N-acetyltransferase
VNGWDGPQPAHRVETERLVLRCYDPSDAQLLRDALDESLDHLRAFVPWAHEEPQPLEEAVSRLKRFRDAFEAGRDFAYGVFAPDESELLGSTGFHARVGPRALEIGYWVRAGRMRSGIATEATAALTRVAFELCDVDRVEIRIDPANAPSLGVPRKLGFVEEATLRRRLPWLPGEPFRDAVVFTLFREDFGASSAASFAVRAFDRDGNRAL